MIKRTCEKKTDESLFMHYFSSRQWINRNLVSRVAHPHHIFLQFLRNRTIVSIKYICLFDVLHIQGDGFCICQSLAGAMLIRIHIDLYKTVLWAIIGYPFATVLNVSKLKN